MTDDTIVFIVDDNQPVRMSTAALLQAASFAVQAFASAEEFLASYVPGHSGCLLLDVRLPGMSGLELQRKLKASSIALPVILISGHANQEIQEAGRANGAFALLEKPLSAHQLIEAVSNALSSVSACGGDAGRTPEIQP